MSCPPELVELFVQCVGPICDTANGIRKTSKNLQLGKGDHFHVDVPRGTVLILLFCGFYEPGWTVLDSNLISAAITVNQANICIRETESATSYTS